MFLQVSSQMDNACCKQRDLNFARTCVFGVQTMFFYYCIFIYCFCFWHSEWLMFTTLELHVCETTAQHDAGTAVMNPVNTYRAKSWKTGFRKTKSSHAVANNAILAATDKLYYPIEVHVCSGFAFIIALWVHSGVILENPPTFRIRSIKIREYLLEEDTSSLWHTQPPV